MQNGIIYGLFHPETGELRYIGKTTRTLSRRLEEHCSRNVLNPITPLGWWISKLGMRGLRPSIRKLQTGWRIKSLLDRAERNTIAGMRWIGARLLNVAEGGEGGSTAGTRSLESRQRLSDQMMGHPISEKTRAALTKQIWTLGRRERLSQACKGRKVLPTSRAKISAAMKGRKFSPETKIKMAAAARARWQDPILRARMGFQKGHPDVTGRHRREKRASEE